MLELYIAVEIMGSFHTRGPLWSGQYNVLSSTKVIVICPVIPMKKWGRVLASKLFGICAIWIVFSRNMLIDSDKMLSWNAAKLRAAQVK